MQGNTRMKILSRQFNCRCETFGRKSRQSKTIRVNHPNSKKINRLPLASIYPMPIDIQSLKIASSPIASMGL